MALYRKTGTTRRHGVFGGVFSGFLLSGNLVFLYLVRHDQEPYLAWFVCVPLLLISTWILAVSLRHLMWPEDTFLEVTHECISWRDWRGFGMKAVSYPVGAIQAVKRPDESPDCLVFTDGTSVALPSLVIPDTVELWEALRQASPHIQLHDR